MPKPKIAPFLSLNTTLRIQNKLPLAAKIASALGLLFLISWFLDIRYFLQFFQDLPTIKFNSSLLLFASGICAWLWLENRHPIAVRALGGFIFLFALASLSQDFFQWELGLDEWLVKDRMGRASGSTHPGRMPGMTSLIYIFFGTSLLLFTQNPSREFSGQIFLHAITFLTFIALMGFLMVVPNFYTLSFLTGISPSIALIWFLFSAILTLKHPTKGITGLLIGKKKGSALARKLTPKIALALIVLSWIWIELQRRAWVEPEFGIALFALCFLVVGLVLVWDAAAWLNRSDEKRALAENELLLAKENLEKMVEIRNQELKGILDSAAVSIMATDQDGLIQLFSKGAEKMLGYTAEEVVGKFKPEQFHVPQEISDGASQLSLQTGKSITGPEVFTHSPLQGKVFSREWSYLRKDGSTFPVQLNISQITSNEGEHLGFIGIATDISQLAESQKELKDLLEKLESKNKQLLNFAHIISHNLRSPVITLDSLINFYKVEENPAEKQELFGLMEEVIKNLLSTMEDTIDILKVQEDSGQVIEEVTLEDILDKTKTALIGMIRETNATLDVDFSAFNRLHFSKSYLESIFLNLISNALKYKHPDRPPHLQIKGELEQEKRVLSFSDNGMGIDLEKHRDKVFGMNKTFHTNPDAKGVGLYIVKTQLESLGAKIMVFSTLHEGTTFRIEFP